jgi:chromosome segregation ATPase
MTLMSKIEDIVDALENKISRVLHKQEILKQTNAKLSEQLAQQQEKILGQQEEIQSWTEKYDTLKIANSMLGSDENKRETKLKINALIRDIDHCIGQLSE